jgi:hypothetical protein
MSYAIGSMQHSTFPVLLEFQRILILGLPVFFIVNNQTRDRKVSRQNRKIDIV